MRSVQWEHAGRRDERDGGARCAGGEKGNENTYEPTDRGAAAPERPPCSEYWLMVASTRATGGSTAGACGAGAPGRESPQNPHDGADAGLVSVQISHAQGSPARLRAPLHTLHLEAASLFSKVHAEQTHMELPCDFPSVQIAASVVCTI